MSWKKNWAALEGVSLGWLSFRMVSAGGWIIEAGLGLGRWSMARAVRQMGNGPRAKDGEMPL
jgi:hypothetical protein